MLPGETIKSGAPASCDCGYVFRFEPMQSNAGWFVGTTCHNPKCKHQWEPNSRESAYYRTKEEVECAIRTGEVHWRS